MNVVAVIPARFASTRFPGKPLAVILERPMIAWVIEAARRASRVSRVLCATDDEGIAAAAQAAGAEVRRTRSDHATGTDRIAEAIEDIEADVILNLQGDEPTLSPDAVDRLAGAFDDPDVRMATLAIRGVTEIERNDPDVAKIVVDRHGNALYFSRAAIPFRRARAGLGNERSGPAWKHVGTYGFRRAALLEFARAPRGDLEAAEDLEQLRALALGWKIRVVEVLDEPVHVDRPEDVNRAEAALRARREGVAR